MTLPSTPSFRLDGRRALVAGASSGIGAACAVALGEAGAEVTLAARSADKLNALAAEMAAAGMSVKTLCVDVSDVEATEAAVAANGPFDVLVNSAGTARHSPATETSDTDFDAIKPQNQRCLLFDARRGQRPNRGRQAR